MSPTTIYQSPYKPTPTSTQLDTFVRWLRLKKYRIEVTYGVYVYTPGEKLVFWTLFCILFTVISTITVHYTHRSIIFFARTLAASIDGHVLDGRHGLMSQFFAAKHPAVVGLTTSAQTRGAEEAVELMNSLAKNSQVA
ncbi:hypothetical protein F5Y12DRAFT_388500 [Xylaria sp. FL1777]|nr:hypothetical protein F5Y12DRAFT_388500 [Xylaria sp. FL1777]